MQPLLPLEHAELLQGAALDHEAVAGEASSWIVDNLEQSSIGDWLGVGDCELSAGSGFPNKLPLQAPTLARIAFLSSSIELWSGSSLTQLPECMQSFSSWRGSRLRSLPLGQAVALSSSMARWPWLYATRYEKKSGGRGE